MNGYVSNIEQLTIANTDYRRILYTAQHMQLVLMCIMPGDEIGEEVHNLDQFIRIEAGAGIAFINDTEHALPQNTAIIIPEGAKHNIINTGDVPLKLYSIYAPPEHADGIVEKTKADEIEEHFDGKTTESA